MPKTIPIALQMYTVRDDSARDFAGTIETVAEIGYAAVELAGYGSAASAAVARSAIDDNGLIVSGMHVGLEALEKDLGRAIEDAETLGCEFVIVPFLGGDRRASLDGYRQVASEMNEIGAKVKAAGLRLCYHNHDFEFDKFGGDVYAYDVFFEAMQPDLVQVELDTFWVKKAGADPAAYIRKYAGRIPLVHLKDMTPEGTFAEVGEGTIDYAPLFAAAEAAGTLFYVVEQDQCANHPPLESVRISFDNLRQMGVVSMVF